MLHGNYFINTALMQYVSGAKIKKLLHAINNNALQLFRADSINMPFAK